MSKVYRGERGLTWVAVVVSDEDDVQLLPLRRDLRDHSPDGFNWGYGGSGPSQLALALCADALGDDERALCVYQDFKWRFVAPLEGQRFEVSAAEVVRLVEHIEASRKAAS